MNRFIKAQELVEQDRIEVILDEKDIKQFIVYSGQNKSYFVNYAYGTWKCQDTCGDWHFRGKDGCIEGSFLCYHILGCILYLFNTKTENQPTICEGVEAGSIEEV